MKPQLRVLDPPTITKSLFSLQALPLYTRIISSTISTTTCELKVSVNQEGERAGPHLEEFQDQVSDVKTSGHAILK